MGTAVAAGVPGCRHRVAGAAGRACCCRRGSRQWPPPAARASSSSSTTSTSAPPRSPPRSARPSASCAIRSGRGTRWPWSPRSGIRGGGEPLTRDRDVLVRAVERVTLQDRSARMRFGRPYISEQQAEQISQFGELATGGNDAFELAVAQFIEEYRFITREIAEGMVRERVREILAEGAYYTQASLSSLEATVRSLAPLPGRKVVVLLTQGFYLGRGTTYETAYDVRRIADAATRANVVIYSIDVGGLTVPAPAGDITERSPVDFIRRSRVEAGMDENRREGMRAVAEQTGGLAVVNRNDVEKGLAEDPRRQRALLPARVPADVVGQAGRFRRIEVRLPGRPGLVARTRRGYFEVAARSGRRERPPPRRTRSATLRERARDALTSIVPLARRARQAGRRLRRPARGRPRGRGERRHRRGQGPPPVPRGGRGRRHRGRRGGHEPGRRIRRAVHGASAVRGNAGAGRCRRSGHGRRPTVAAAPPRPLPGARRRSRPGFRGRGQRVAVGRGAGPVDAPTGIERPLPLSRR